MDRVLAGEVPDLEAERVTAPTRWDAGIDADLAPRPSHERLPSLPFLQDLERAHRPANPNAATIPSIESAAERQLFQRAVEACLVVDLVGREMSHHVLDAPAATVAAPRPVPRVEAA